MKKNNILLLPFKILKELYLPKRFFALGALLVFLLGLGYGFAPVRLLAPLFAGTFGLLILIDLALLFSGDKISADRDCPEKLSNGDPNLLRISLRSDYPFRTDLEVIDEIPADFQIRDFSLHSRLSPDRPEAELSYELTPVRRGEYDFGKLHVFVRSFLGILSRRYSFREGQKVPVYPSFIQLKKFRLAAFADQRNKRGLKKIRKLGHNMEFDRIREYVPGDDRRALNWKATARANKLMVNLFRDERSQQIYSIIDKGRLMKMPFDDMTLLDYAVNASLVISDVALRRSDKAGLLTFNKTTDNFLPAENRSGQIRRLSEALYKVETAFEESDFSRPTADILRKIKGRSLLLFFTNLETYSSMDRQISYLRNLASRHLLVVIFFENTELKKVTEAPAIDTETVYLKAAGEKFVREKHRIVAELNRCGIHTVLTGPAGLTVNTINKYLELKARQLI